jgi:hypothetical protein
LRALFDVKTAKDKRIKLSRELLRYYVLVLANSGMRPGEAHNLRIRDAHQFRDEKGRTNYRLVLRGKTVRRAAQAGWQAGTAAGQQGGQKDSGSSLSSVVWIN